MILKTKKDDELKLRKEAKESIKIYAKPEDTICYIPYLDVPLAQIKYVKFVLVHNKWVVAE